MWCLVTLKLFVPMERLRMKCIHSTLLLSEMESLLMLEAMFVAEWGRGNSFSDNCKCQRMFFPKDKHMVLNMHNYLH